MRHSKMHDDAAKAFVDHHRFFLDVGHHSQLVSKLNKRVVIANIIETLCILLLQYKYKYKH